MKIDLRDVTTFWINMEEHVKNRDYMTSLLNSHGFNDHHRTPGIRVSGYEGNAHGQKINHFMGVGFAQLNAIKKIQGVLPGLILEDDVRISSDFNPILDIPDNTDAVYLGISTAGNAFGTKINSNYARIFNVLAAHAILYISEKFLNEVYTESKNVLLDNNVPFDLVTAKTMNKYNVITPLKPYFYQSNEAESANKWEHLTNSSLKIYEKFTNH